MHSVGSVSHKSEKTALDGHMDLDQRVAVVRAGHTYERADKDMHNTFQDLLTNEWMS